MVSMTETPIPPPDEPLQLAVAEIERHVGGSGWDQGPALFALVDTGQLVTMEPTLASEVGVGPDAVPEGSLTPVEQESLPDMPLEEILGRVEWPTDVTGCALVHEVLVMPPELDERVPDGDDAVDFVATHPDRREARLAVGVLRDGTRASVVRLRGSDGQEDDTVLAAPDLAPNLAEALLATLS